MVKHVFPLLMVVSILTGWTVAGQTQSGVKRHFEKLDKAYYDVHKLYPSAYTCRMESKEVYESMDMKGQHAWGPKAYIFVDKGPNRFRLTCESVRDLNAKPLFNLMLGLWQIRLAIELKKIEAQMPKTAAGIAYMALAAPAKFEQVEQQRKDLLRFGVRAKSKDEKLQELLFIVDQTYALKSMTIKDNKGASFEAVFRSKRMKPTGDKWLIEQIKVKIKEPTGKITNWQTDLDYMMAGEKKEHVVYKYLKISLTDEKDRPIKKNEKDVNPVSFEFEKYRISAGPANKKPTRKRKLTASNK